MHMYHTYMFTQDDHALILNMSWVEKEDSNTQWKEGPKRIEPLTACLELQCIETWVQYLKRNHLFTLPNPSVWKHKYSYISKNTVDRLSLIVFARPTTKMTWSKFSYFDNNLVLKIKC